MNAPARFFDKILTFAGDAWELEVVEGGDRAGLGQPIAFEDRHLEARLELPDDLDRDRRAAGDADAQRGRDLLQVMALSSGSFNRRT